MLSIILYVIIKKLFYGLLNLGCIEMHPWYSRIDNFDSCKQKEDILDKKKCRLNFPDFIVFDLDPYIYSGKEKNKVKGTRIQHPSIPSHD